MRKVKYAILGAGTSGLTALGIIRKQTDDFVIINGGLSRVQPVHE